MMQNLVEHLRKSATEPCDGCCYGESMTKAADEIERLRAALEQAVAELSELRLDSHNAWEEGCAALLPYQQNGGKDG